MSVRTRGAHRATATPRTAPGFRADIQGLRALAVGLVVLDHAHVPGFPGGYIGVDVFFVISGFLITGLLINDIERHHRVRFLHFYARRALRILPMATVVIVTTSIASVLLLGVLAARSTLIDGVWAVFFVANVHFAQTGTNYFASTGTSALQHYWSLAVEEQFYLVWPAFLGVITFAVSRFRREAVPRRAIALTLVVLIAGSLMLSISDTANNATGAYFSTIDRAWELAIGALIAVVLPSVKRIPAWLGVALTWTGIGAVLAAALFFTAATPIPGWRALLPVLGTGALLVGGRAGARGGAQELLARRPLQFVGDISYSLYLWHWPMLILGAAYLGSEDSLTMRFVIVAAAVLLSSLTYRFFENPIRHTRVFAGRLWRGLLLWPVATGLVVAVSVAVMPPIPFAAAAGPAVAESAPLAVRNAVAAALANAAIPTATSPGLAVASSDHVNLGNCSAYRKLRSQICQLGDPHGSRTMVLFGNSHSVMWEPALAVVAKQEHWKFYPVVKEACGYDTYTDLVPGLSPKNQCTQWYEWARSVIARLHPDLIIMGSYTATKYWVRGEQRAIAQLKPLAPRFILFSDTPRIPSPSVCLLQSGATQKTCLRHETPARFQDQRTVKQIAALAGVNYLDVSPWFCWNGLCPSVIDGLIPYYDGAHLTPEYSKFLTSDVQRAINLSGGTVVQPVALPGPA